MNPVKRLLVATDLSAPARHAADRAALVAREVGARLDLFHVANVTAMEKLRLLVAEVPAEIEQRVLDAAREEMRELAANLLKHHGVAAGVQVASGPLLPEIIGHADTISADLLVLGARGSSFMRHLLIGSTAERMVRKTRWPMLIAKQPPHEPYRTLLVPVDFSPFSLRALRNAQAVAPGADVVLLHAFEVPFESKLRFAGIEDELLARYRIAARQEALGKLRELRDEVGLPPERTRLIVLHGDASRNIIEQEQEQDCDLIVMGKHGESVLEDLLLGSVTKHVLAESQGDVLVSV
ncbi:MULTISPECIES: universal stress protein [Aromatoleum]|uniref:Universal stress protein n=1 Tax=Aromatoleum bremense TaxID=76115 RepID=A0ABX1NTH7_9RHOO|nr:MULTISPECIES: universal stress protein [Aromatoleum]NMG15314.1 universal stress protein [Aromatoleum bremense]NMG54204.1 universal stress protein [Aromatoleum aromaticum]QTQ33135.1 Universal stress response protein A [Aromatoleum bremense]